MKLVWGREENSITIPAALEGFVRPFGVSFPLYRVFLIAAGAAICIVFWALLLSHPLGNHGPRGCRRPRDAASIRRQRKRLFTIVFGVGSGLAGLAGGLAAPIVSIGPGLHAQVLIDAFVVVVIGGMGSFPGALAGALLLGQANAFGVSTFPSLAIVVPFVVMTLVLIVRPWGLLGKPE